MDKNTAIKSLKRVTKVEIPPQMVVILTEKHAKEIADFIEQQEKYAELGRLAVEIMNQKYFIQHERELNFCPVYMWDLWKGLKEENCGKCIWINFCQKRAELLGEVDKNENHSS